MNLPSPSGEGHGVRTMDFSLFSCCPGYLAKVGFARIFQRALEISRYLQQRA